MTPDVKLKRDVAVAVHEEAEAPVVLRVAVPEVFENWYERFAEPREMREA